MKLYTLACKSEGCDRDDNPHPVEMPSSEYGCEVIPVFHSREEAEQSSANDAKERVIEITVVP